MAHNTGLDICRYCGCGVDLHHPDCPLRHDDSNSPFFPILLSYWEEGFVLGASGQSCPWRPESKTVTLGWTTGNSRRIAWNQEEAKKRKVVETERKATKKWEDYLEDAADAAAESNYSYHANEY